MNREPFQRLDSTAPARGATEPLPRLLAIELWGVGDLMLAAPFLRAASERFKVSLLAKPAATDLAPRFFPGVEVLGFDAPWSAFGKRYAFLSWYFGKGKTRWAETLRARAFEIALSARPDPRDALLAAISRAPRRLGFSRAGGRLWLNEPLPPVYLHRGDAWRALAERLDLAWPAAATRAPAPRRNLVVVHSGAARATRRWPLGRYREIVLRLRASGRPVRLLCDADQIEAWRALGEREVDVPRDLRELIGSLEEAAWFLGNDSGPGHLAAALGVPTFTLYGPNLAGRFGPRHPRAGGLPGKPCRYRPCHDACRYVAPHCLLGIEVGETWSAVEAWLEQR